MISFLYDKRSTYRRIWNIVTFLYGKNLIIGIICFAVGAYINITGYYLENMKYVSNGSVLLFCSYVVLIMFFMLARTFYKQISSTYKNYANDGLLHYTLCIRDTRYVLKCIESEKEIEFSKNDIKRIIRKNGTIIVEVLSNRGIDFPDRVVDFPNREDIYELFTDEKS